MAATIDRQAKRKLRECKYKVPEGYLFERHDKCVSGPDDVFVKLSHDSTKKLGSDENKRHHGLQIRLHTDYQYPGDHSRMQKLAEHEGLFWVAFLVVVDMEWLPKNRVNLLCVETGGDYVLVLGYDYVHGKGDVFTFERDYSFNESMFREGYPPELTVASEQRLTVILEAEVTFALLYKALAYRGYRIYYEMDPNTPADTVFKAGTAIVVIKL